MKYDLEYPGNRKHVAVCRSCGWKSEPLPTAGLAASTFDQHQKEVHVMNETTLVDQFGRKVSFIGESLDRENTDTDDERKPQWLELEIWRTEKGNYVVCRDTCYRIFHSSLNCPKADGYTLVEARERDIYNCPACAQNSSLDDDGFGQETRRSVEVYSSAQELIESFRQDGKYNNLARAVLAEISRQDTAVDAAWNTVVVP